MIIKCKRCHHEFLPAKFVAIIPDLFACPKCGEFNILSSLDPERLEKVSVQIFCALIEKHSQCSIDNLFEELASHSMSIAKRYIIFFDKNVDKRLKEYMQEASDVEFVKDDKNENEVE